MTRTRLGVEIEDSSFSRSFRPGVEQPGIRLSNSKPKAVPPNRKRLTASRCVSVSGGPRNDCAVENISAPTTSANRLLFVRHCFMLNAQSHTKPYQPIERSLNPSGNRIRLHEKMTALSSFSRFAVRRAKNSHAVRSSARCRNHRFEIASTVTLEIIEGDLI